MTPTSERKGTKKACKMCRTGELEDEGHLFLRCPVVQAANTLGKLLSANTKVPVDTDKAITTNQIPTTRKKEANILYNIITATYRQLVWMTGLKVWTKGGEKTA
ncbi:hypothetical protein Bpfe_029878 [Biomphalaria pfeifferi]|uniref:Uncharacterized protein n=1 Tax=Biomphalaria pfeifferi TaxID=112525 RepID=A0AAD8AQU2_BIOPF|nr:hypothetical protein Bpfe_029878 [Biomphalaria pfeifferi]